MKALPPDEASKHQAQTRSLATRRPVFLCRILRNTGRRLSLGALLASRSPIYKQFDFGWGRADQQVEGCPFSILFLNTSYFFTTPMRGRFAYFRVSQTRTISSINEFTAGVCKRPRFQNRPMGRFKLAPSILMVLKRPSAISFWVFEADRRHRCSVALIISLAIAVDRHSMLIAGIARRQD